MNGSLSVKLVSLVAVAAAAVIGVSACSSAGPSKSDAGNPLAAPRSNGTVVVGSGNFPESELLAEIYLSGIAGQGNPRGAEV